MKFLTKILFYVSKLSMHFVLEITITLGFVDFTNFAIVETNNNFLQRNL